MARTIADIQLEIVTSVQADEVLGPLLSSTSKVSIWRLWTYVVAVAIWTLETIFDIFRIEIDEKIATLKPHSLRWYALKAKAFQYGQDLVDDADYYDNTGLDDTDIEASLIIDHAAVVEQTRGLRIKVATTVSGDLAALTTPQLNAFKEYMKRVKDAGVKLLITSAIADSLKLKLTVYYNPLVLDATGGRADGTSSTPVQDAINNYLKNLPFNGVFVVQSLIDVLQQVDGARVFDIQESQARYGALAYTAFRVQYIPDAGYLRIFDDADLQITFLPYSE